MMLIPGTDRSRLRYLKWRTLDVEGLAHQGFSLQPQWQGWLLVRTDPYIFVVECHILAEKAVD